MSTTETKTMMKKKLIVSVCLGLAAGLSAVTAAETMTAEPGAVLSNSSSTVKEKVGAIQTYVADVEKGLSSDKRKEETLSAGALKAVTDENWKKLHGYYDGDTLKRMKLYPQEGSKKTEEFYLYSNEPVFVFVEENGAGKEGHDKNAVGSKYYFAGHKLIAATAPDGKAMDISSAESEKMSDKLQKEAVAFGDMLK
jgi:hypothetical protein